LNYNSQKGYEQRIIELVKLGYNNKDIEDTLFSEGFETSNASIRSIKHRSKKSTKIADDNEEVVKEEPESDNVVHLTSKDKIIDSVDALIAHFGYDKDDWYVVKPQLGSYQMIAKVENTDMSYDKGKATGKIKKRPAETYTLYKCSVTLVRKKPVILEAAYPQPLQFESKRVAPKLMTYPIGSLQRELIVPDQQIGFFDVDDTIYPIHDPSALDISLALQYDIDPDGIIILGDILDLAEFGRWTTYPEYVGQSQRAINAAGEYLQAMRDISPNANINAIEGNHDSRPEDKLVKLMPEAYGLQRYTQDVKVEYPVLSTPFLLDFTSLYINFHTSLVGDYKSGEYQFCENGIAIHGIFARNKSGATAQAYLYDDRYTGTSVIYGHTHRMEWICKTIGRGNRLVHSYSPGCLCDIKGNVPPHSARNNWQQGVGVVYHNGKDIVNIEHIPIVNGEAFYRGKAYKAGG
jgi:hypothetical protein